MTRVVLVRHGETVWHTENRYAGSTDVALTDEGRAQAQALGRWAKHAGLAAVYCSDLSRSRETALPAAEATALPLREEPRLRELDFGAAEGLTADEMRERFPVALQEFRADPAGNPLPGGEPPVAAVERGLAALREICKRWPDDRVLVVAHSTLIRLLLCDLLGRSISDYRRLFPSVRNCAVTELSFDGEQVALLQYNVPTDVERTSR